MALAYIDNQNLYMATRTAYEPWDVDMRRLRVYLREKYGVEEAYLFMGAHEREHESLHTRFRRCGYELVFRPHGPGMQGTKKGNVDTDVVFGMMRDLYEREGAGPMYLVSGDGDYWRTVEHLRKKGRLGKVLLPSKRNASSLYKQLGDRHRLFIDTPPVRGKIERR